MWGDSLIKTIKVSQLKEGMYIAQDIYLQDFLLVSANTKLKEKVITKLKSYGIKHISVYSEEEKKESISREKSIYFQRVKSSTQFQKFNKEYEKSVNDISIEFNDIVKKSKKIDTNRMLKEIELLVNKSESSFHMFDMLYCIKGYDDSTFTHSINVALISRILGQWLNFQEEDIRIISLCGMLHDIGKLLVPREIITKPDKLTKDEYEEIKKHSVNGFSILKDQEINQQIKLAALQHHEKCDGSGYPFGYRRNDIVPFSKIITIADVYDAMTADRVYRQGMCPFKVINIFEEEGLQKYETKYILTFLNGIVQTYINNSVQLNNGETGKIIMINQDNLSKPLIKTEKTFIDLSRNSNLYITQIL